MAEPSIEDILARYFDGACSAAEKEVLCARLSEDRALRRRLIREGRLRAEIRQWAKAEVTAHSHAAVRKRPAARLPVASPRRASWARRITLAAACVVAVLGVRFLLRAPVPPRALATVQRARDALVARADERITAAHGLTLCAGDRVLTGTRGALALEYHDVAARVLAGAQTHIAFNNIPDGLQLELTRGRIELDVQVAPGLKPPVVLTPHARLQVAGTRFAVAVDSQETRVDVWQGVVCLERLPGGGTERVTAGQYAVAAPNRPLASRPIEPTAAGGRVTNGLLALYRFDQPAAAIRNLCSRGGSLDLIPQDRDAIAWLPDGALSLRRTTVVKTAGPAARITDSCMATREVTLEAWLRPAGPHVATVSGRLPARVVTLSGGPHTLNCMIGQERDQLRVRVNVRHQGVKRWAALSTPPATATPRLMHVALTRAVYGAIRCYIDGQPVTLKEEPEDAPNKTIVVTGDFETWSTASALALGNEIGGDREWLGDYYLVAVYDRALTPREVARNYRAGPPRR